MRCRRDGDTNDFSPSRDAGSAATGGEGGGQLCYCFSISYVVKPGACGELCSVGGEEGGPGEGRRGVREMDEGFGRLRIGENLHPMGFERVDCCGTPGVDVPIKAEPTDYLPTNILQCQPPHQGPTSAEHQPLEEAMSTSNDTTKQPEPFPDHQHHPSQTSHIPATSQASQSDQDPRFAGLPDIEYNQDVTYPGMTIPAEEEFRASASHQFWTWSVKAQNWYHFDKFTNSFIWAPLDFD